MAARIIIFGATGFTGRLVAERLAAQGAAPVLAGRSEAAVRELAERLGGLEWRMADALRRTPCSRCSSRGDVLVSTVGPFVKWGEPAVRAAIAAHGHLHRLDRRADVHPPRVRGVRPARRACRARAAARHGLRLRAGRAGRRRWRSRRPARTAVRVDIGYYAFGAGISAGTRRSAVGVMLDEGYTFRDGALRSVAHRRARALVHRPRQGSRGDVDRRHRTPDAARRVSARCTRSTSTSAGSAPLARPMQAGSLAGSLAMRMPGVRGVLKAAGDRGRSASALGGAGLGDLVGRSRRPTTPAASACRRSTSSGGEPYALTADTLAWAARRAAGPGHRAAPARSGRCRRSGSRARGGLPRGGARARQTGAG